MRVFRLIVRCAITGVPITACGGTAVLTSKELAASLLAGPDLGPG